METNGVESDGGRHTRTRGWYWYAPILLALGILLLAGTATHALPCGDEIWMVSTRHLGNRLCERCLCHPHLCYQQYLSCHGWVPASESQYFCEQSACGVTIVYVHGNRISHEDACGQGMRLYWRIRGCCPAGISIRFVIWSWPSSPIPARLLIRRDARVKYRRTEAQSFILAQWLAQASPETNITMVGYSFGARVVLGALHLVGGGCLNGVRLPCTPAALPCINVALWAAATENSWLAPGGCHGCALRAIHCGLITVNRVDPVLRRFRRVIIRARDRALGQTGLRGPVPCCGCHGRLYELNVTACVGRRHEWERYVQSSSIIWHTARVVLSCCCYCCEASAAPGDPPAVSAAAR